jgi:hypothetical protein
MSDVIKLKDALPRVAFASGCVVGWLGHEDQYVLFRELLKIRDRYAHPFSREQAIRSRIERVAEESGLTAWLTQLGVGLGDVEWRLVAEGVDTLEEVRTSERSRLIKQAFQRQPPGRRLTPEEQRAWEEELGFPMRPYPEEPEPGGPAT